MEMDDVVPSPCARVCVLEDDVCQGCGRTLEEISRWRVMDNGEKRAVWERLEAELNLLPKDK